MMINLYGKLESSKVNNPILNLFIFKLYILNNTGLHGRAGYLHEECNIKPVRKPHLEFLHTHVWEFNMVMKKEQGT